MPEIEELININQNTSLIAAAGCGKTETIARAIKIAEGRQLVLTHTNAGVISLLKRLRKYQIPTGKYHVDTIASWFLKICSAYPKTTGLINNQPEGVGWQEVYKSTENLLSMRFFEDVVRATYSSIFIDEYQDCSKVQHNLIMLLSKILPVHVLGDPLQGIFGFAGDPSINWETDVEPNFKQLPELLFPWRWENGNKKLGDWLASFRTNLIEGNEINLENSDAISWHPWSIEEEISVCYENIKLEGSLIGIHMWPADAHGSARRLGGILQSMEEMECRSLLFWANDFDLKEKKDLLMSIFSFISECVIKDEIILDIEKNIKKSTFTFIIEQLNPLFLDLIEEKNYQTVSQILMVIANDKDVKIHRRELMREMIRACREFNKDVHTSLHECAWITRNRTRQSGRVLEKRIISRTLLIKGLEFDNAIVLNASKLQNKMNTYVAFTRASRSLTVLSQTPIIHYK